MRTPSEVNPNPTTVPMIDVKHKIIHKRLSQKKEKQLLIFVKMNLH